MPENDVQEEGGPQPGNGQCVPTGLLVDVGRVPDTPVCRDLVTDGRWSSLGEAVRARVVEDGVGSRTLGHGDQKPEDHLNEESYEGNSECGN